MHTHALQTIPQVSRQTSKTEPCAEDSPSHTSELYKKMCPLHKKKCELVCLKDYQLVCTDCAIFGEHRQHQFKTTGEFDKDRKHIKQNLEQMVDACCSLFSQPSNLNQSMLLQQMHKMKESVRVNFKLLRELVEVLEAKALEDVDTTAESVKLRLKHLKESSNEVNPQLEKWQVDALHQICLLDNDQRGHQAQYVYRLAPVLKEKGQRVIKLVKSYRQSQWRKWESQCRLLKIKFNYNILDNLQEFSKVYIEEAQTKTEVKPDVKPDVKPWVKPHGQQSLLEGVDQMMVPDDTLTTKQMNQTTRQRKLNLSGVSFNSDEFVGFSSGKPEDIEDLKQSNSSFLTSTNNSTFIQKPSLRPSIPTSRNQFKIPQKYQKLYNSILKNEIEVVDLTNAQLGDEVVLKFAEAISRSRVKTAKFIRNKLTDAGVKQILCYMTNVITLNLSQNSLTEITLDNVIMQLGSLRELKSIALSQNKIKQRNVKQRLNAFKEKGIIISL